MIGNVALGVQQVMISGGIDVSFPAFVVIAMSLVVCAMVDWGVPETGALVPFLMATRGTEAMARGLLNGLVGTTIWQRSASR